MIKRAAQKETLHLLACQVGTRTAELPQPSCDRNGKAKRITAKLNPSPDTAEPLKQCSNGHALPFYVRRRTGAVEATFSQVCWNLYLKATGYFP